MNEASVASHTYTFETLLSKMLCNKAVDCSKISPEAIEYTCEAKTLRIAE